MSRSWIDWVDNTDFPEGTDGWPWFASAALDLEPELMGLVGKTLAAWATIDTELTMFVTRKLLRADIRAGCELLMPHNWSKRRELILRLTNDILGNDSFDLAKRATADLQAIATTRHRFAHDIWGAMRDVRGYLVQIPFEVMLRDEADIIQVVKDRGRTIPEPHKHGFLFEVSIYDQADLTVELNRFRSARDRLWLLTAAVGENASPQARAQLEAALQPPPSAGRRKRSRRTRPESPPPTQTPQP